MGRGILSSFFGFSEEQAEKDVKSGEASARNDAEVAARADWMADSARSDSSSSGSGSSSSSSGGGSKR